MKDRDELIEIGALLKSRVPIILIETHEEPRILKLLHQACNLEQQVMFRWSITDGITRFSREEPIHSTNNLLDALKHIDKSPQNGVYVFCDAHPGLKDAINVRLIREIALEHYRTARTLVFVSPKLEELPSEILRMAAHFRPRLPTRDEIKAIVAEEAELWQSHSGEKARAERGAVDTLILHLLGLEQDDVRRLVRQALRADGQINSDDVRRVLSTKHAALGGGEALGFETSNLRFADVGGLARMKHWINLRRGPFLDSMRGMSVDSPKGVVLLGVQGGGKSLAARAIAGEWNVPLMRMDFGALYNKYYGETERNLRQAFAVAEGMAPCVLWMDEIEKGVASAGSGEQDGGVSRRVLGSLLTWMADQRGGVFVVATANDVSALPPELMRKGRFDEIFFVDLPDEAARAEVFHIHLRRRGIEAAGVDVAALARLSEGYSGAEIEQVVVSARYRAAADKAPVDTAHLEAEVRATVPLSVTMAEKIDALRAWAEGRTVPAN